MKDFSKEIKAYALKNAVEYGKAEADKIIGKLFQHGLDKKDIKQVMPLIVEAIKEINKLSNNEREKLLIDYQRYVKEREEKEKELSELPNSGKNMIFRLAPFPSGALHIGNAKTILLNSLYAEKYNAKLLLIMDDTIGSEEKPITLESYKLIEEALEWLDVKYQKPEIYKSDRIEIYYKYALDLINKGRVYVCHCKQEILRKNRENGIECAHRSLRVKDNLDEWKKMFSASEGSAVLRLKTDMQNPNPAFRDRVLFRIAERKHPRIGNKYRVWPTLEMTWSIDDHLLGITHIIRGNDLMIETEMEKFIWDIFGWKHPETIHTGLVKIDLNEAKISKSKAQKEVASGKFTGWDDPRTWSIQALKRRGIKAESIREFVKEIGLNKSDITIPIDSLYAINRKLIDSDAERFYFVEKPIKLEIKGKPGIKEISKEIHPDKKEKRKVKVDEIYISKNDINELKGQGIRLLHLYNIKLPAKGKRAEFTSLDNKNIPKIQWVSSGGKVKILMPSGTWISGLAESSIRNLKPGEVVQFERFGFCRFDAAKKEGKEEIYEFWFAHK